MRFLQGHFFPAGTFERKIFGKYGTLLFGFDFLGKNIFDKACFCKVTFLR